MKYIRFFMAMAAFALLVSTSAKAEDQQQVPTLSEDEMNNISQEMAPKTGFQVDVSEKSLVEGCKINIGAMMRSGMRVSPKCCEDKQCREALANQGPIPPRYQVKPKLTDAEKQAAKLRKDCLEMGGDKATCSDPESARAFINGKLCYKFGGSAYTCDDPDRARQFVLDQRAKKRGDQAAQKVMGDQQKEEAPRPPPPVYPDDQLAARTPYTTPQTRSPAFAEEPRRDLNYFGLAFRGFGDGSFGPYAHWAIRPLDRVVGSFNLGLVHVNNQRLHDNKMEAVDRGSFNVDAMFQLVPNARFSVGIGPFWTMIGRLGSGKNITAQIVGGAARFHVDQVFGGTAFLSVYAGGNLGPDNGIMAPGTNMSFDLGWRY